MNTTKPKNLRLAALDLDGTLLGPDLKISADNHRAIERLAATGVEIVLASGRHYHAILPYARELPMVNWIVSSQGAEIASVDRSQMLTRTHLDAKDVTKLQSLQNAADLTAVYYASENVFTTSGRNGHLDFYTELSGRTPVRASSTEITQRSLHKVVCIGDAIAINNLRANASSLAPGLQVVQTHEQFLEFMPLETTKAAGLQNLTAHLGLNASQVVAFGDGDNDISMFKWAGYSFAMAHGWPDALANAAQISPAGAPESALARAIDQLLANSS